MKWLQEFDPRSEFQGITEESGKVECAIYECVIKTSLAYK